MVKSPPANAGGLRDVGSISGLGRSPGEGNGTPLQYSCLGNPMDGGAWCATVFGVAKLDSTEHTHTHRVLKGHSLTEFEKFFSFHFSNI